ncbi:MAG: aminoglycoside phosphotransferase family protein [Ruminococcaceae bacterium]|nr:aminoglycoside phosphotransferase family protein [Oscillospiraceae bacterium]
MTNDDRVVSSILKEYGLDSVIENYENGHINDTYRCVSNGKKYTVQRINTSVFKNPYVVMDNIERVTEFLKKKIVAEGGDPMRETLTVVKTLDGKNCYTYDENNVFRAYYFIDKVNIIETNDCPENMYNTGKGFGHFLKLLNDFPIDTIFETIPDFHDTPKRMEQFKKALEENKSSRAEFAREEIDFVLSNENRLSLVTDGIKSGDIPLRVTHNDTKTNNLLFSQKTGLAQCVIDLDTVMPGSMLYDFGDALRYGGSTAAEDETDLDKVHFDLDYFEAFAKGYLEETKDVLTPKEIELIPYSVWLMTFECGIRFLADHFNGDTYFRVHREGHNLDRARNQFKLCKELIEKEDKMKKIVAYLM